MRQQLVGVLAAVLGVALSRTSYDGYKVYRLISTGAQLELLKKFENVQGYDIWSKGPVTNASLDIMVAPQEHTNFIAFLNQKNVQHELLIGNVQATVDNKHDTDHRSRSRRDGLFFLNYHTYPEINAYLEEVVASYPNLTSLVTIGQSTENRDLNVLKISRGGKNPVVWVDAGIHAREWIAPAMALYIINQLLENPANSALLDGVDWHILPVVNPDGYQWSHTNDRFWRKTRSWNGCNDSLGVDANRNWDFHWNEAGVSQNPCEETYCGPSPFSEPETVAVRDYIIAKKKKIKLYLSLHSYGNYILLPWAWTKNPPKDWKALNDLAKKANAAQRAVGGDPAVVGSTSRVLYPASGGSYDWVKGVAGIDLAFTVELPGGGRNGFDPPPSEIEKIVTQYFQVARVFGEYVRDKKYLF